MHWDADTSARTPAPVALAPRVGQGIQAQPPANTPQRPARRGSVGTGGTGLSALPLRPGH